jgi:hypothetical protein
MKKTSIEHFFYLFSYFSAFLSSGTGTRIGVMQAPSLPILSSDFQKLGLVVHTVTLVPLYRNCDTAGFKKGGAANR